MPTSITAPSAERIALALGGARRSGDGWVARCPAHDDSKPSLSIRDMPGYLAFKCFAGCPSAKVRDALRERGLLPKKGASLAHINGTRVELRINGKTTSPAIERERVYRYENADGTLAFEVVRRDFSDGTKDIRQRLPDGTWRAMPAPRPLYGLPKLRKNADRPVLVVEGEKCALAAANRLGKHFAVTTWAGGASATATADWEPLRGRDVIVWPDNDEPGAKAAADIAQRLEGIARSVRVVRVPERKPSGWDIADAIDADGWSESRLTRFIERHAEKAEPRTLTRQEQFDAELQRAATLPLVELASARKALAKEFGVPLADVDRELRRRRAEAESDALQGRAFTFEDPSPAKEAVALADLLDGIEGLIRQHVILTPHAAKAIALWVVATWVVEHVECAPILLIRSPEPRCGKTTLLEILRELVRRPLPASNTTASALFRAVEKWTPTLLIDEGDTFLRGDEDLRGLINAGHTRATAVVLRVVGDDFEPRAFRTFSFKAIAAIDATKKTIAPTILDRAIVIDLRRKLPTESVEKLRESRDENAELLRGIRAQLARVAVDHGATIKAGTPNDSIPKNLNDRAADSWSSLLAIADIAGGAWPVKARKAAVVLSATAERDAETVNTELLADCKLALEVITDDRIAGAALLEELLRDSERPWQTFNRGGPLSLNQLSRRLAAFGIHSRTIRLLNGRTPKGYAREDFEEAFARYLTSAASEPIKEVADEATDKALRRPRSAAGAQIMKHQRGRLNIRNR